MHDGNILCAPNTYRELQTAQGMPLNSANRLIITGVMLEMREKTPNQHQADFLNAGRISEFLQTGSQIPLPEGQIHSGKTRQGEADMDPYLDPNL